MRVYKYFWDLPSATSYGDCWVKQHDANCSTGGGFFKWIIADNTAVTNINGIRVKPTAITLGYWERVYDGNIKVDWFGTQNTTGSTTLAAQGITQGTCDARYGSGLVTAATDNYDTAAVKYAFYLMGLVQTNSNFGAVDFSSKDYYINSSCNLPKIPVSNLQRRWILNGNGAFIINNNGFGGALFKRTALDFAEGNTMINHGPFTMNDFWFKGTDAALGSGQKGIELHALYSLTLNNTRFTALDDGIHLVWCLKTVINNVRCDVANRGIALDWGTNAPVLATGVFPAYPANWSGGGSNTTSNCHQTTINDSHFEGSYGMRAGIWASAVDGLTINNIIIEQSVPGPDSVQYMVYINQNGASTVSHTNIYNVHAEGNCAESIVFIRANKGVYRIDGWQNDATTLGSKHLVEVINPSGVGTDIQLWNWADVNPYTLGAGDGINYFETFHSTGGVSWYFFKCKNITNVFDGIFATDTRWWPNSGVPGDSGPASGSVEEVLCVRFP